MFPIYIPRRHRKTSGFFMFSGGIKREHLSIYLYIYLSIYLSVCLSISISTHIYSMHNIIYNVVYIVTLNTFLFENVAKCQLKEEIFKIKMFLYFDFLQIFYGLTMKLKV